MITYTWVLGIGMKKKRMEFPVFVDNIIYYIDLNNEN